MNFSAICVVSFGCSTGTSDITVRQVCLAEMTTRGKSTFVSAKTDFVKRLSKFGYSNSHDVMHTSNKLVG